MKAFRSIEKFRMQFNDRLVAAFRTAGFILPQRCGFMDWLSSRPMPSVVLVIDEHDAPLTEALANEKLFTAVRNELLLLHAAIKSQTAAFRLVFATGVTKLSRFWSFPELNDFTDISLMRRFSTLLGFTREETLRLVL